VAVTPWPPGLGLRAAGPRPKSWRRPSPPPSGHRVPCAVVVIALPGTEEGSPRRRTEEKEPREEGKGKVEERSTPLSAAHRWPPVAPLRVLLAAWPHMPLCTPTRASPPMAVIEPQHSAHEEEEATGGRGVEGEEENSTPATCSPKHRSQSTSSSSQRPYADVDAVALHGTASTRWPRLATAPTLPSSSPNGPDEKELIDVPSNQRIQKDYPDTRRIQKDVPDN